MLTPTDIREKLPEFSALSAECIQRYLDEAAIMINAVAWDDKYDMGVLYFVGHYLLVDVEGETASGPATEEEVHDVSASYSVSKSAIDSGFGSTHYGRRYIEIRRTIFACRVI